MLARLLNFWRRDAGTARPSAGVGIHPWPTTEQQPSTELRPGVVIRALGRWDEWV
jgi:hypothetical protein